MVFSVNAKLINVCVNIQSTEHILGCNEVKI